MILTDKSLIEVDPGKVTCGDGGEYEYGAVFDESGARIAPGVPVIVYQVYPENPEFIYRYRIGQNGELVQARIDLPVNRYYIEVDSPVG
ncbi:hypothetical protein H6764_00500 [Candidatus Nomurabacteria bacterium]|nr:hypothetical protein [Candidatus Nomurabacteria bacterium]